MADERINQLGRVFNAATQHVSGEVASTTTMPAAKSLQRVSNAIIDALAEGDEPRYYHEDLDTGIKGDILRPLALGYKAGATAAYAYEQGAKFLFGRGQRHQDFARRTQPHNAPLTPDGYDQQVAFKHSGTAQPGEDAAAHKARSASFYKNNIRAIKQDGILGFAVKATAVGVGTLVGAAFCGSDEKANALSARIADGAHTFNAGARNVLLGAPMGAAVLAGISIGLAASGAIAAWKGLRAIRQRAIQARAPAPRPSSTNPTHDSHASADETSAEETSPDDASFNDTALPELKSPDDASVTDAALPKIQATPKAVAKVAEVPSETQIRSPELALAAMADVLALLNPDLEAGMLPTTEDTSLWPAQSHDTIERGRELMYPISFEAYVKLSQPEKETWKAINRFMLRCKPANV